LNFVLRGGQEDRDLHRGESSQFTVVENENGRCLQYRDDVSKTNQGDLSTVKNIKNVLLLMKMCKIQSVVSLIWAA